MEWICLLLPACLALKIRYERKQEIKIRDSSAMIVLRWAGWVLTLNVLSMGVVLLVFGFSEILTEAFHSFSFSLKYMLISIVFALVLPYVVEIREKYIGISIKIEELDEEV